MANRVVDCGVPRANPADIIATAVVTDMGVPTAYALVAPTNAPMLPKRVQVSRYPSNTETATTLGIGVPLSPYSGVTNN